jgi:FixJ family two-component response regulator
MTKCPFIAIVDDDESVRESLLDLLKELGFSAQAYPSAEAFLASSCVNQIKCLVLDVAMPGMTGPDLQRVLAQQGHAIPVVFVTAHGADAIRPRLLAQGAVACLSKPFSDTELLEAIKTALGEP